MYDFTKRYCWNIYLALAVGAAGMPFTDWRWWLIVLPTIILVRWSHSEPADE